MGKRADPLRPFSERLSPNGKKQQINVQMICPVLNRGPRSVMMEKMYHDDRKTPMICRIWRKRTTSEGKMWHSSRRLFGLVVVIAVTGAHVQAQSGGSDAWSALIKPRDPAKIIQMFDADGDGKIEMIEYRLRIVKVSIEIDKNRDDFISPDEIPGMGAAEFEKSDLNKDGRLSTYEFVTTDSLKFETLDADGDGFISASEIESHQARRQ